MQGFLWKELCYNYTVRPLFYCRVHLINRLKGGSPMNSRKPAVIQQQEHMHRQKRRAATSCSVCTRRIWFDPIYIQEPEGVPVPRACWLLCKECHGVLVTEFVVHGSLSLAFTHCHGTDRRRALTTCLSYQSGRAYQRSQMDYLYCSGHLYYHAAPSRLDCDDCRLQIGREITVIDVLSRKEVIDGS